MEKSKLNIILFCIAVLAIFVGIYALNSYFPIFNDDWIYSFIYGTDNQKITGFADILKSQHTHYFIWGGRSVVHFIAQSMLYLGQWWGDLLNSLAYVALVLVAYFIADYKRLINPFMFFGISVLIWVLIPDIMYSMVWITGSANYLWGCMIVISFIAPYCMYYLKYADSKHKTSSVGRCILFLLFGVIAGWTNENLVIGLLFFIVCSLALLKYEKKEIPKWAIFGLIGAVIGCYIMLSAPGNYIRNKMELSVTHGITDSNFHYSYYFYRMVSVVKAYFVYGIIPTIIYAFSLVVFMWKGTKENKQAVIRLSLLLFSMAIVSLMVMAAAPLLPERVWFGVIVLIIIATSLLYINLDYTYKPFRIVNYALWIPMILFLVFSYSKTLSDVIRLREVFDKREAIIQQEKTKGVEDFVFYDRFEPQTSCIFYQKVNDIPHLDTNLWETAYAKYWGVKSIKIESAAGHQ